MSLLYEMVYKYADEGQLHFSFSNDPVLLVYVLLKYLDDISRYLSFTVRKQNSHQVMLMGRNHLPRSHCWF